MNREIKFRYWDGEDMYYPPQDELSPVWDRNEGTHLVQYLQIENGTSRAAREFNGQILQYIELTDKNDKLIYEKDIFDIHQTVNGQSLFVVFSCLPFLDIRYAHDINRKYEYSIPELLDAFKEEKTIEVVGNIFQNPELLDK